MKQEDGQGNSQIINTGQTERLHHFLSRAKERRLKALLQYLDTFKGEEFVFFWDDFEQTSPEDEKWLWSQISSIRNSLSRLYIIVATRSTSGLEPKSMIKYVLEGFSESDSDQLLMKLGVSEPSFRKAVYERLTKGHPLMTRMAAEKWVKTYVTDKPITIKDIPEIAEAPKAVEWLQNDTLKREPEPIRTIIAFGVALRYFNRNILNKVVLPIINNKNGTIALSKDQFEEFCRRSFIVPFSDKYTWKFHDLVIKVQLPHVRNEFPNQFNDLNKQAYNYFMKEGKIVDALYHHFLAHPDSALVKWEDKVFLARKEYNYGLAEELFQLVEHPNIELNELQRAHIIATKAHYYRQIGDFIVSQPLYEKSLSTYHAFPTIFTEKYYQALHGYAVLLGLQNNVDQARRIYKRIVEEYSSTDPYAINAWATLESNAGNNELAESLFRKCANLNPKDISTLNAWARFERDRGNYQISHQLLMRALELSPSDPEDNGSITHLNLARLALIQKEYEAAREHFSQAEKKGGPDSGVLYFWANMEKDQKNYTDARKIFAKLHESNPRHRLGLIDWALMEFHQRNGQRANSLFEKALVLDMPLEDRIKTLETWGQLEWRHKNFREAAQVFKRLFKTIEDTDDLKLKIRTLLNWARMEAQQNKYDIAQDIYENKALSIAPDNIKILKAWAKMEKQRDNHQIHNELTNKIRSLDSNNDDVMYEDALRFVNKRKYDQARELLEKIISVNQNHTRSLFELAKLETRAGNFARSDELYERLLRIAPNNYSAMYDWAMSAKKSVNDEVAIERFKKLLSMPKLPISKKKQALRAWASTEGARGNLKEARDLYQQILNISPNNIRTYQMWASLEHQNNNKNEVQTIIEHATKIKPDDKRWLANWSRDELKAGNFEGARKLLEFELDINPENDIALTKLAGLFERAQNYDEAARFYKTAKEVNPDNSYPIIQWAIMEHKRGSNDLAESLFEEALSQEPKNVRTLETWGRMKWAEKDFNKAAILFARIAEVQPNNVSVLMDLAKLEYKNKNRAAAISVCNRILAIKPNHRGARRLLNKLEKRHKNGSPKSLIPPGPRYKGKVKFFIKDRGFGFISIPNRKDLFVHFSEIIDLENGDLQVGETVEFSIGEGSKGPQAKALLRLVEK